MQRIRFLQVASYNLQGSAAAKEAREKNQLLLRYCLKSIESTGSAVMLSVYFSMICCVFSERSLTRQFAYKYSRQLVIWRRIPMRIEFLFFKKEVVALFIAMSEEDLLKRGNPKIFNAHCSKRDVVVHEFQIVL